jgi:tetratricopeptide (TPR) repeat protein
LCSALAATLALAGCGGAQARKARHIEKGEAFYAAGNFEKARVEFRNALQIAPNDSQARYENGRVDEKLGNQREAAQFYLAAIDSNPDNVAARAAVGRLFLFGGAPERALEVIKPALVKFPQNDELLTVRAAARVQLKDPDGALADAEQAVHLAPTNEDAVEVLAGVYKSRNEPDKARALLEGSIKQIPKTVDLRLALAQLDASLNREPEVEGLLVDLVRLDPSADSHRIRLAQFYARLNHVDEAERVLREGIKALPDDRTLKITLVDLLAARRGRDVAEKEIASMVAAYPQDYDLQLAQGQFFEQGQDYAKAEAAYRKVMAAADLNPSGILARDRLALMKIERTNDPANAQLLIAEVLVKNPRDNDALIMRSQLALNQKDPKTAIADLRSVLRDQPNSMGVMRALARAHMANGEPALAEETMRRAVEVAPKDSAARLDLAQLLVQVNKPEQAKPVIDELVKQEPANAIALETQFQIGLSTGDLVEARSAADALVAAHADQPAGYFEQAQLADREDRRTDAIALYNKALDLRPDATDALDALSMDLVQLKRLPEALKHLDAVSAQFPKEAAAPNTKGALLLNAQRFADAEASYRLAIDRQPGWWVPYRGLALTHIAEHQVDDAIATMREGIAKAQTPQPLQVELAAVYERLDKPQDAEKVYEDELTLHPDSDFAANNLAMLLVTYNKDARSLDRAKTLASRFANSPNAAFLDTYGWVLYKHGDPGDAVSALQTALSKTPNSPASLYHLGMAQASVGQASAARDSLERSLKGGKRFSGMDEAKATLDKLNTSATAAPTPPKT